MTGFQKIMIGIGILFLVCIGLCLFGFLFLPDNEDSTVPIKISPTIAEKTTVEPKNKDKIINQEDIIFENDGNYFVGEDLPEGLYNIECLEGNGTVMSIEGGESFLASFDNNKLYRKANLINGQKIELYGVKVKFIRLR